MLGAVEEDVPQVLRRRVRRHLDRYPREHPQVERGLADVLALACARHVHVARNARMALLCRLELALARAKGAHAAHGALATRQQVARLAVVADGPVVVVVVGHDGWNLCAHQFTNATDGNK